MTGSHQPVPPGSMLGVLGGGQLGRMFALAARRMGYRVAVFTPEEDSPAGQVADHVERSDYGDLDAVARFARATAGVTFEFENVPAATADAAHEHAPLRPGRALLAAAQDRLVEKRELTRLGLPVAAHAPVTSDGDLMAAAVALPGAGVLKTARLGYDGKGQRRIASSAELEQAWRELGSTDCVLEELVPFAGELSIVGARGADGDIALYEPLSNTHSRHILDVTVCPAPLPSSIAAAVEAEARRVTREILAGLDVVGVLCVEFFYLADGSVIVNEIAPRPHNSGHLTIDAHECCQFEQQVRALAGLPLGSTRRIGPPAAMANLLGDLWSRGEPNWSAALDDASVRLHLYGKAEARPGRKMGHLVVTDADPAEAERRVRAARAALLPEKAD